MNIRASDPSRSSSGSASDREKNRITKQKTCSEELSFSFLVNDVFTQDRIVFFPLKLLCGLSLVLRGRIEVTRASRRNEFNNFAHDKTPKFKLTEGVYSKS